MSAIPVEFSAPNGPTLRGHRYGEGERWAVLVHDEGEDLDAWRGLVGELRRAGLCVLAFDLAGHGASDDPWKPAQASANIEAALRFAESQGARALYLIGAGAGATAALVAAGTHPVRALVALSPRAELNGVPRDAVRESRVPKLFLVGSADRAAADEAAQVRRRCIGWGVLGSFPVAEQGAGLFASAWRRQACEHVLAFLRDYP